MNGFALFILIALLVEHGLHWFASWLNLGALRTDVPAAMRGVYDPDSYRRSQEYTRASTLFSYVTSTVDLATLLLFWFAGGFGWLDRWVRSFGFGPVLTGVLFIAALLIGKTLLALPFNAWSTFVLEERFGFNRTTPATFFADLGKGFVLSALLGGPLLALVLWLFLHLGDSAWLWGWVAVTAFLLGVQVILPIWILPLFHRFEPLEDGALRSALERYAGRVGFELGGIFVIDGSRRSNRANAFFTGFGRTKRIALYDTLVERQSVPELVAVLAHEVGHSQRRHVPKMLVLSILHTGLMFFLLSIVLEQAGLFAAFHVAEPSVHAGLVFFTLLFKPIETILGMALGALSRKHEFEADRFAVETVDEPEALATALEKLSTDNLNNLTPHPFFVALHHSHPPVLERLRLIRMAPGSNA
ncbi:MAG: M48 family metallopeptidase [Acidobacteriota bacterium]